SGDPVTRIPIGIIGDAILYAEWEILTFNVEFLDFFGSNLSSQVVDYGDPVIQPNDPIKGLCTFDGWYLDTEYINEYDFEIPVIQDYIIYAKFSVEVTLNIEDSAQSVTLTLGDILDNLSTIESTKTGYSIGSWNYIEGNETFTEESELDFSQSITFEAVFEPNTYLINFDLNYEGNEDVIDSQEVVYDGEFGELPEVTRRGCIFLGWYYEETLVESTDIFQITNDITLTAEWEIIPVDLTWVYIGSAVAGFFVILFITLVFKKIIKSRKYQRLREKNTEFLKNRNLFK
ncbi:MAG: InlB B-repeat-containing protein, partial [Clostridia bacterium]|nr:InlB B-repeat-containing protein [Clostridia bacterium]